MATRGWSGQPPTSPEQARERLMDAAIACLQRYGLEKTGNSQFLSKAASISGGPTLWQGQMNMGFSNLENRMALLADLQ